MGLWSTIGKIGAGIAAPFTGGASLAAIPAIDALGQITGATAAGRAQGRQAQDVSNQNRDQLATQQYIAQQQALMNALQGASSEGINQGNLDLNQRKYALEAPNARAQTAVRGDALNRAQDFRLEGVPSHIPRFTAKGGFTPSMLSPESRALGRSMTQNALSQQQAGDQFAPMTQQPWQSSVMKPPKLTDQPTPNAFDNILNIASTGAGIASAIGGSAQTPQQTAIQKLIEQLLKGTQGQNQMPGQPVPMNIPPPMPQLPRTVSGIPQYPGMTPPFVG